MRQPTPKLEQIRRLVQALSPEERQELCAIGVTTSLIYPRDGSEEGTVTVEVSIDEHLCSREYCEVGFPCKY